MALDTELFGKKKFSNLLEDIYQNQRIKDRQIKLLIADMKPLITNLEQAIMLMPIIKDFMDISIKNDDQLVKLTAIAQRMLGGKSDDGNSFLSEEEKASLLKDFNSVVDSVQQGDTANGESTQNKS